MNNQGTIPVLLLTGYSPRCEVIKENLASHHHGQVQLEVLENILEMEELHNFSPVVSVLDLANLRQTPVACVKSVKKKFPDTRILALHIYQSPSLIEPLFDFGIDGYLTYEPSRNELENALQIIIEGNTYFPESLQQ